MHTHTIWLFLCCIHIRFDFFFLFFPQVKKVECRPNFWDRLKKGLFLRSLSFNRADINRAIIHFVYNMWEAPPLAHIGNWNHNLSLCTKTPILICRRNLDKPNNIHAYKNKDTKILRYQNSRFCSQISAELAYIAASVDAKASHQRCRCQHVILNFK